VAIKSFKDEATKAVFEGYVPKAISIGVAKVGRRKLNLIDAALRLDDLKVPPGNKLHPLTRDRAGQHAIRINDQYRVCFRWTDAGAEDVEITDYH
jgi:proteic killer suppression protein